MGAHTRFSKSDFFTLRGAETLANRIRNYWAIRGKTANVWTEIGGTFQVNEDGGTRRPYYVVRSDMVAGCPK